MKVGIDQIMFAPIYTAFFFTGLTLLNGGSVAGAEEKVGRVLWPTLITNWKIWPAVQILNSAVIPVQF
jgi:protein Mpv17